MKWGELREEEFDAAIKESGGLCIMPIGCMEMHGQHLPVATDTMKIEAGLEAAAKIEPVMEFPPFRFGDVQGLVTKKGSIRLTVELEQELLKQLCSEIARNGFKKIMLLNSHGGNKFMLNNFVRSVSYTQKDYVVMTHTTGAKFVQPPNLKKILDEQGREALPELLDEDIEVIEEFVANNRIYGHAGFGETAMIFGCRPDLVRMDRADAVSGLDTHEADYLKPYDDSQRWWGRSFPNSYMGDVPRGCNERFGKLGMRLLVEHLVEMIRVLKYDENMLRWNAERNAARGRY
ncbi:MAG: creatininase family protein [Clostridia bacterium]|nr:creatininase family protein [Clostridia bacterium]